MQKGLICEPVNPLCRTWDFSGKCLSCYPGYTVCAEGCAPDKSTYSDKNCNTYDSSGRCVKCSAGSYLSNGACAAINPNCKAADQTNGNCLSCYVGYSLQVGQCVLVPLVPDNSQPSDLLCAEWRNGLCAKCSASSYLSNGVCTQVNPLCRTYDNTNGACLSCYVGYVLSGADCALAPQTQDNSAPSDLLCAQWSGNLCQKCSQGSYFRNGVCVQADPQCKTFDNVYGSCLSCYAGYFNFQGQCLVVPSAPNSTAPSDPLCSRWQGSVCLQCSNSAYFRNGACVQSDPLCRTFDSNSGACLSCYYGYALQGGKCSVADTAGPVDALCAKWANGVCSQCSQGAYFSNGVCTQSNTLCKTYDSSNGACTSCYNGYVLSAGNCAVAPSPVANSAPADPNCAQWNGRVCVQCSPDAYFQNGVCVLADPLCRTWDRTNGNCLSCYKGYSLAGSGCVIAPNPIDNTQPSDLLCARWANGVCAQCSQGAYFVSGVCTQSDPLCKSYDSASGSCLSCYNGYSLANGKCIANTSAPSDQLCAVWNGAVCAQCSPFSYFSAGVCTQVNPQCKTFNSFNGACTSCYAGYVLSSGACNAAASQLTDLLCAVWRGPLCVQCAQSAYFRNGVCTQSNPQCRTFDSSNGNCLSCYNGYVLQNGNCNVQQQPQGAGPRPPNAYFDIYCKKLTGQTCTQCFYGFVLQNGKCVANFDNLDCPP